MTQKLSGLHALVSIVRLNCLIVGALRVIEVFGLLITLWFLFSSHFYFFSNVSWVCLT